jgi:hypothetical protein
MPYISIKRLYKELSCEARMRKMIGLTKSLHKEAII